MCTINTFWCTCVCEVKTGGLWAVFSGFLNSEEDWSRRSEAQPGGALFHRNAPVWRRTRWRFTWASQSPKLWHSKKNPTRKRCLLPDSRQFTPPAVSTSWEGTAVRLCLKNGHLLCWLSSSFKGDEINVDITALPYGRRRMLPFVNHYLFFVFFK